LHGPAERGGKGGGNIRISKTPPNEIALVLVPSTSATWLNVTRTEPIFAFAFMSPRPK
jgi:hypothetical protein